MTATSRPAIALLLALAAHPTPAADRAFIRVLSNANHLVMIEPMTIPILEFRSEGASPSKGLLSCQQVTETRATPSGTRYPALALLCDGQVKLILTGIDLQSHGGNSETH